MNLRQTTHKNAPPGEVNARLAAPPASRSGVVLCAKPPVRLSPPRLVAIAKDEVTDPKTHPFPDKKLPLSCSLEPYIPKYGGDILFGKGHQLFTTSAGKSEGELKETMWSLLSIFAGDDDSGMAERLFRAFLAKQPGVQFFEDVALNAAFNAHSNIESFCKAALHPPSQGPALKTYIHQALANAAWNIHSLIPPTHLGAPAVNLGRKWGSRLLNSGDFANGLGVMINGVQHVYAIATHYLHDPASGHYSITLRYHFYDVFGLDNDDVKEQWAKAIQWPIAAVRGITAWWQLQHQYAYPPLITRVIVERTYTAPTTP